MKKKLSHKEFRALLDMSMASDPNPAGKDVHEIIMKLVQKESIVRGYSSWVEAYHEFKITIPKNLKFNDDEYNAIRTAISNYENLLAGDEEDHNVKDWTEHEVKHLRNAFKKMLRLRVPQQ